MVATPASASCDGQVAECERVLEAADRYINLLEVKIEKQDNLNKALEVELRVTKDRLYASQPSWYEKPSFLVPTTAITTLILYGIVRNNLPR